MFTKLWSDEFCCMVKIPDQQKYRKTTKTVRPCGENERESHSEKNARFGHSTKKKKREAKPKGERSVYESYVIGAD